MWCFRVCTHHSFQYCRDTIKDKNNKKKKISFYRMTTYKSLQYSQNSRMQCERCTCLAFEIRPTAGNPTYLPRLKVYIFAD